jgi:hypothetical protein
MTYYKCGICGERFSIVGDFDWKNVGNSTADITPRKKAKYCPMCGASIDNRI